MNSTYFRRRFPIFTYVWGTEIDSIDREWKGNVRIPIAEIKIMTVGRILNFHFYYPRLGTQLLLQYNRIYIIFRENGPLLMAEKNMINFTKNVSLNVKRNFLTHCMHNMHTVENAEILSHFFRKNFVKAMVLQKKLLNG